MVLGQRGPGIDSFSLAITEAMDPGQRRTSQRAELLAAIEGVRRSTVGDVHVYYGNAPKARIIVSDSEYVVRGMTEWLPQWKVRSVQSSSVNDCICPPSAIGIVPLKAQRR